MVYCEKEITPSSLVSFFKRHAEKLIGGLVLVLFLSAAVWGIVAAVRSDAPLPESAIDPSVLKTDAAIETFSGKKTFMDGGSSTVQDADGNTYGTVLAQDGRCWLDRNLGTTRAATSSTDDASYGWYFQWGRDYDGHQISNSGTTTILSSTDTPGHGSFIRSTANPYDWRSSKNDSLWQGVSGTNNPCPAGFRLPTKDEWVSLVSTEGITNSATAFSSTLKLPLAGHRSRADGSLVNQGSHGYYWSSGPNGTYAYLLYFDSGEVLPANFADRAYGFSVRCLKD